MSLLDNKNDIIEKLLEDYMTEIKTQLKSEIFQQVEVAQSQIDILKQHIKRLEDGVTQIRLDKYDDNTKVFLHIPSDLITDISVFKHELY